MARSSRRSTLSRSLIALTAASLCAVLFWAASELMGIGAGVLVVLAAVAVGWLFGIAADAAAESALEREIESRRVAEHQLRLHQQRLQATVSSAPILLFAVGADGRFELIEGAALSRLGLAPEEIVGEPARPLLSGLDDVADHIDTALVGSSSWSTSTVNGVVLEIWYHPVLSEDGTVTGMIGVAVDATESASTQRRHRTLFERAPVALWQEDFTELEEWLDELREQGVEDIRSYLRRHPDQIIEGFSRIRILDVNDAAVELVGASSREELIGYLRVEDATADAVESLIDQAEAIWLDRDWLDREVHGSTFDGDSIEVKLGWTAPRLADGSLDLSAVVVSMVDVSEQRRARRALEELVESKDRFVASVSHELRTPMTAVVGLAEELHHHADRFTTEEMAEFHRLIAEQSREMADIVADLLVIARADLGTVTIHPEPIDGAATVKSVIETIDPELGVIERAPSLAWADPVRTRQILRNLLSNALRYGGPRVRVEVDSGLDEVTITVADDGDEIPPDARERIFEAYERAHHAIQQPCSVGLGLTVSRMLAEAMGGSLTYRHTEGWNAFQLRLPRAEPAEPISISIDGSSVRPG